MYVQAQSTFYIPREIVGPKFTKMNRDWRANLPNGNTTAKFNRMVNLRDDDVHYGETGAQPLQKYVKYEYSANPTPNHHAIHYAAVGGSAPVMEEVNPDGKKVSGFHLRGTVGLYLDLDGGTVEATTACREFINQLRSLIDVTKAAFP